MGAMTIIAVAAALALAFYLGRRANGAKGSGADPRAHRIRPAPARKVNGAAGPARRQAEECRWKLRAPAKDAFPARYRCTRCNADVSSPSGEPPTQCYRVGRR